MESIKAVASRAAQSSRARRVAQAAVIGLVLLFFGVALYSLWPQLVAYKWEFDPLYLVVAFLLLVVRGPVSAFGWWSIVRRLGYELPFWKSVRLVYYSALAGYLPGSMWHAVSRVYLAEREGLPRLVTAISVLLETVMVAVGAALVSALSLLAWHDPPLWVTWGGALILLGLLVLITVPNLMFHVLNWLLARIKRPPLTMRLSRLDILHLLWPYALNWLIFGATCFALVGALYPHISVAYLPAVAGLFCVSWLAGYLAVFVPQGLVVREAVITGFLTGVLGLPAAIGATSALLSRLWFMLGTALWGAISTRL